MDKNYGVHSELYSRAVYLLERGHSVAEVAGLCNVGRSTIYEWRKHYDKTDAAGGRRPVGKPEASG